MEVNHVNAKLQESRLSTPFYIDLNETPICSPRETVSAGALGGGEGAIGPHDQVPPPPAPATGHAAPAEGCGTASVRPSGKDKAKVVLDINALPSDVEGEDENGGFVNSGMHGTAINNSNNSQVTCSNLLFLGNQFDVMKTSANLTSIPKSVPVDTVQQRLNFSKNSREADFHSVFRGRQCTSDHSPHAVPYQNLGEMFLQALREFIFDNHGVLEDGWRVEFLYCQNRCKTLAVYCSPDGNRFESMFDVACHLGLVSNCHSFVPQDQSDRFALVQNGLHIQKRRKESVVFSRSKDSKECRENLKSSFVGELLLGVEPMDAEGCKLRDNFRVTEAKSEETGGSGSSYCKDGFPLQFEDFFILSLGEIDPRPSYHNTNQIWPVGYKSSWHDKITGSLFICDISDGGDCGPLFKVQRYPCSAQPIPIGSTVLSRSSFGSVNSKTGAAFLVDDHEDIDVQMIFSDSSPPHIDFDVFSGTETVVDKMSNCQPMCGLKTESNCVSQNVRKLENNNRSLADDIGEFLVEGRSTSSVWKMVSQNLVRACHEVYKQTGVCKLCCMHDTYGWWSSHVVPENVEAPESADALSKFCHMSGPHNAPRDIQSNDDLTDSCEALVKWLGKDRFGLDIEFVQEIIEQLPGIHACSDYKFLDKRSEKSKLQTVGSGFLLAKRKGDVRCDNKRKGDVRCDKETDSMFRECKRPRMDSVENPVLKDFSPPGKPMSSKLPTHLIGDVLQSWELLWRFSEVLGLEGPLSFMELEEELIDCYSFNIENSSASTVNGEGQHSAAEGESLREVSKVGTASDAYRIHKGEIVTKAHCSLLKILLTELQSKLAAFVDPTMECGESKSRKRRKKEADNLIVAKKTTLDLLPVNELTWPELARRYVLTVSSTGGNLDSIETVGRESCKVFHCLQGRSGPVGGSLPGVAGMEADALLLAEATKQIFGPSKDINDHLDYNDSDVPNASKTVGLNDGEIPEWAQVLEPVRKLPTNVGARIRKRIYEALEKNPPDWARRILEHSISKEVYKGNASGPTKKAVLALLADVHGESQQQKPNRKKKTKNASNSSDVIMKQCQKVLRLAASADEEKVFCNLLGRTLHNTSDNDDEGLLGFPTMVSRPLDFRTIDLRLAFGAYGESHEAFLEDVREVWHQIRTAYADHSDLVHLAEKLSQNFEELYEKEVLTLVRKLVDYETVECLSSEAKKEMEEILEHSSDIPKAPWDEGVCKVCGVDKDDDNVLLCDKCDSGYHTYCLSPPLARVPDGNWYCPSCVTVQCISQGASEVPRINSRCRKKKHQGEFTHQFLENLSHLGTTMEVKDYWEYSLEERIFLLKFLGEEVLNSANVREHLEQCAPISNDLQQKLRSLSTEWRSLKFREEILAEKVAKINANVLNGVANPATGRMGIVLPNCDKLMGWQRNRNSLFSSFPIDLLRLDGLQWQRTHDFITQPQWFYSKDVSEQHSSSSGSQLVKIPDSEFQINQHSGNDNGFIFEDTSSPTQPSCGEDEFIQLSKAVSIAQELKYDSNGDLVIHRNVNRAAESTKCAGSMIHACEVPRGDVSSITYGSQMPEHGRVPHLNSENLLLVHPSFVQEWSDLKAFNLEANIIKSKISVLQDSMASLELQLQKASLRKEYLGRDSLGRLYWIFTRPGSSPWLVVDGTMMVQHKDIAKEPRDVLTNNLNFRSSPIFSERSNVSCPSGIPASSWFSYQSDAEIEELIIWLRDNGLMERDLLESLLQRLQVSYKDSNKDRHCVSDSCEPPSTNNDKSINSGTLATKALAALEKKYGPCFEMTVNKSQNAEVTSKEKMYRCECLEPIWPSRPHCQICHWSFSTSCELKEHKAGKCCSATHASSSSKANVISKGKAVMRTEPGECSDNAKLGKSGIAEHESGFGLFGFQKDLASPYDIEEICSKFIVRSSNKELVREIGLLGSNGVPSLVPCTSPYLTDPTLKLSLSWENEVDRSGKPINAEIQSQLSGLDNVTSSKNANDCNGSTKSGIVDAKHKEAQNMMSEKRERSLKFSCSKLGSASFPVISDSSLKPLVGRGAQILRQLKLNLLDMEAILAEEALKPSKACLGKRGAWRAFVKSAKSVFEVVQATIVLENMIKTEYLKNEWCYWSSLSAAAKISTVSSLALRVYILDAAIVYEKSSPLPSPDVGGNCDTNFLPLMDLVCNPKPSSKSDPTDNGKPQSRSGKKRKDSG